jgi:hypothetical protein
VNPQEVDSARAAFGYVAHAAFIKIDPAHLRLAYLGRAHLASLLTGEVEKLKTNAGVEADIPLGVGEPAKTVTAMTAELNEDVLVIGRPVANRF